VEAKLNDSMVRES